MNQPKMESTSKHHRISRMLHQRMQDFFISHKFAQEQIGYIASFDPELSEQNQPRRILLEVEKRARALDEHEKKEAYLHQKEVQMALHDAVYENLALQCEDIQNVLHQVLAISDSIPAILDLLSLKAATASKLDPLLTNLPWLGDELVSFINQPQYQQHLNVKVSDPKLAVRYLGLDNLQLIVPVLLIKRCLPRSTEPFKYLKRRLWEETMAMGLACKALAEHHDKPSIAAYTLGMLSTLGKLAIARIYFRLFDDQLQHALVKARNERDKDRHQCLVDTQPEPLYLRQAFLDLAPKLTLGLLEAMHFERLPMAQQYKQFLHDDIDSTLASYLRKAQHFVVFQQLNDANLIEPSDVQALFLHGKFSKSEVALLRSMSLKGLNITLDC